MEKYSDQSIEEMYITIGKNVKKLRNEKKMTQLELTHEMGLKSVSLVSAAELYTNKTHFNIEHLHKISRILEVDISEFFKE